MLKYHLCKLFHNLSFMLIATFWDQFGCHHVDPTSHWFYGTPILFFWVSNLLSWQLSRVSLPAHCNDQFGCAQRLRVPRLSSVRSGRIFFAFDNPYTAIRYQCASDSYCRFNTCLCNHPKILSCLRHFSKIVIRLRLRFGNRSWTQDLSDKRGTVLHTGWSTLYRYIIIRITHVT